MAVRPATAGRPRDWRIDSAIKAAVLRILNDGGYGTLSIQAVAKCAHVPRSSVYRRWPSKQHLVAHAIVAEMGDNPAADTGNIEKDLRAVAESLLRAFSGPLGRALPALVSDMANDSGLASLIRRRVLDVRRESMRKALTRARLRGDIAPRLDLELFLDMLTAPFYFRTLFGHARIDRQMAKHIVQYALRAAGCQD